MNWLVFFSIIGASLLFLSLVFVLEIEERKAFWTFVVGVLLLAAVGGLGS